MTQDCLFCKILAGELPCDNVYENDQFIAFQALHQVSKGHTLIVPKEHSQDILDMDTDLGKELLSTIQKIGTATIKGLGASGFNIGVNTKPSAGQVIFHTHIHIIPRYENDNMEMWKEKPTEAEDRTLFAQKIISALD